jgi:hypothetical protein
MADRTRRTDLLGVPVEVDARVPQARVDHERHDGGIGPQLLRNIGGPPRRLRRTTCPRSSSKREPDMSEAAINASVQDGRRAQMPSTQSIATNCAERRACQGRVPAIRTDLAVPSGIGEIRRRGLRNGSRTGANSGHRQKQYAEKDKTRDDVLVMESRRIKEVLEREEVDVIERYGVGQAPGRDPPYKPNGEPNQESRRTAEPRTQPRYLSLSTESEGVELRPDERPPGVALFLPA